ncbi:metal ABC transporter permease [Schaalia sp. lx-100]|uniref:metal ABC transporter permease n=1 Tax=Schaalia sp. lx-100 TaxID=2899081 RepID=UPI001E5CC99B|nr:iron chelate uptake ABC transporter family permease subunit [Schaalia sp. lx-100]MCD4557542.1 metal ABC transporter permease [Schaalia sp. lx-100]
MIPVELIDPLTFFASYTFRTMLIGTALVGVASSMLGAFLYLTKQSLISDVMGHSATSGVTLAFIVAAGLFAVDGRSMLVLTLGSIITSTLAVLLANAISVHSRIGIDAAMVICLALFYGGGMVLLRVITHSTLPNRGGIDKYMFGNAATLTHEDLITAACFAAFALIVMCVGWKELKIFAFDPIHAQTLGFSPKLIRFILLGAASVAVIIGIKAVGLILVVAFAITPAAAARQWTHRLSTMVLLSGIFGGSAGVIGSYISVNFGKVPTGPVIVLVLAIILLVSLFAAPQRSVIRRHSERMRQRRALLAQVTGGTH